MYPNLFGTMLFMVWPVIIYKLFKKLPIPQAIFISVAIATMLLPAQYNVDYPLIPPLNRDTLTSITILFILFFKKVKNPIFKHNAWTIIFVSYLLTIGISTLANQDAVEMGEVMLRGSAPYDVISNWIQFLLFFMPFFFGRNFFNNPENNEFMFKTLTVLALVYSVLMVYEVLMSPHIHLSMYGYFPGDFIQSIRGQGFRPVVLIGHGLAVAFWFSIASIASLALYKSKAAVHKYFGLHILIYFLFILLICKTVSAVIYFIFAIILMYAFKLRKQILITCLIPVFVMLYPLNSVSQYVAYNDVLEFVGKYSHERKDSLKTRFDNETRLIDRALERPLFGWSGWGRQRVYSYGQDITVTDGQWIMQYGSYGTIGFILYYAMLFAPLFMAFKSYRYIQDKKQQIYFTALAITLSIGILDSVPNTGMMPIHFLLGGALAGQAEFYKRQYMQARLTNRIKRRLQYAKQ